MKKILAIDTTTEACSVALLNKGEITQRFEIAPRRHTELILAMVQNLLQESDTKLNELDAIAVDQGPGSFTGVRIGAGVAQGLAYSIERPVIPISSLAALAYAAHRELGETDILACIDARMNEVYWGCYQCDDKNVILQGTEQVSQSAAMLATIQHKCVAIGSGAQIYLSSLSELKDNFNVSTNVTETLLYPTAASIAVLASRTNETTDWVSAEAIEPVYLRNNIARVSRE